MRILRAQYISPVIVVTMTAGLDEPSPVKGDTQNIVLLSTDATL